MENHPFFSETVGRRKTSIANLRIIPGLGQVWINGRKAENFFAGNPSRLLIVQMPFCTLMHVNFDVKVIVRGGGLQGQAAACRLALTRSLVYAQPTTQSIFRKSGYLTRDSRKKERRKYGLKKARKAPQFSKR